MLTLIIKRLRIKNKKEKGVQDLIKVLKVKWLQSKVIKQKRKWIKKILIIKELVKEKLNFK